MKIKPCLIRSSALSAFFISLLMPSAHGASLSWDADGVAPVSGGTGTWNTSNLFWDNAGIYQAWSNAGGDDAVFGVPSGLVNLGEPITANSITFDANGYVLSGSALTLSGGTGIVSTNTGVTATLSNNLTIAAGGMDKTGAGTLVLAGTNSITGGIDIQAGTLLFANTANIGTSATILSGAGNVEVVGGTWAPLKATNHTFSGSLLIQNGTVSLTDSSSSPGVSGPQLSGVTAITVRDGTFATGFSANAGNINQVNDAATLTLNSSTFSHRTSGSSSGSGIEVMGALTLGSGANSIALTRGNRDEGVTFASLAPNAGSTLQVTASAALGGASNYNRLVFTSTPTLQNGILPYLLASTGGGSIANGDFGTYGVNGVALYSAYTTTDLATTGSPETLNFKLGTAQDLGATSVTANSLYLTSGVTITGNAGTNLTLGGNGAAASSQAAFRSTGTTAVQTIGLQLNGEGIFWTNTGTTTISSVITGAYGLTKDLTGTLVLGADNSSTLTGPISINGGTLAFSNDNNLGNASNAIQINRNSTLAFTGSTATLGSGRSITLGASTSGIAVPLGSTLTVDSVISGTGGSLNLSGGGTLVLMGNNSYTGDATITGGSFLTLSGANGKLGAGNLIMTGTSPATPSQLVIDNSSGNNTNRIGNSSSVSLTNTGLTFKGAGNADSSEDIGVLTVSATGSGRTVLTVDANGVTNSASVTADSFARTLGQVLFRGTQLGNAPGPGVGSFFFDTAPTLTGSGSVGTPTVGIISRTIGDTTIAGNGSGFVTYDATKGVRLLDAGEYSLNQTDNTANTNIRITSNTANSNAFTANSLLMEGGTFSGTLNLTLASGDILVTANSTISKGINNAGTLFITTNGGNLSLAHVGSGSIVKYGTNSLTLTSLSSTVSTLTVNGGTASSSVTGDRIGALTINSGGTYSAGANNNISDSGTVTINAGGSYDINGRSDTISAIAGTGAVTNTGAVNILDINNTGTPSFDGLISGAVTLRKRGNGGTLTLNGANNTFTGGLDVLSNNATLSSVKAGAVGALGTGPISMGLLTNNAQINLNGFSQTVSGLSINAGATGANNSITSATAATLTVTNADNNTFAGNLTGAGLSLVKSGVGILTLSGVNTYAGNTTVNAGSSLVIAASTGQLSFKLGSSSGLSNQLTGDGTVTIDGSFVIDTTAADALASGTWVLENVNTSSYNATSFSVVGFTDPDGDNKWTKPHITDSAKIWTFDESDGTLTLGATSGTPFELWMNDYTTEIPDANDRLPGADPDKDGTPNVLEFALMGDPADGSNKGLISSRIQNSSAPATDELTLIVAVRDGATFAAGVNGVRTATVSGITYTVEGSADLVFPASDVSVTGPSDTAPGMVSLASTAWEYYTFKLDASEGLTGKGFLRLKVTEP